MRSATRSAFHPLLAKIGIAFPIFQAPMAGTATPTLAAAVSEAGGLGALGLGPISADAARLLLADLQARTRRPFGVNLFCTPLPPRDSAREQAWLERFQPDFDAFGIAPPTHLESFGPSLHDPAMLPLLLETKPAVVSFHLGIPDMETVAALRDAGIVTVATATSFDEARRVEESGFDAVVAQGIEAGDHRGIFDVDADDARLSTLDLVRTLAPRLSIPVIAAGGIMDGSEIGEMLRAGAAAAQLGTAFLCCPETNGHMAYRAAMLRENRGTILTRAITGRPARAIANGLAGRTSTLRDEDIPPFPLPFTVSKALAAAAASADNSHFEILLAGTGMGRARALPATALMHTLVAELERNSFV